MPENRIFTVNSKKRTGRVEGRNEPFLFGTGYLQEYSDKVIRVVMDSGRNVWLPMSVIHDDSSLYGIDVLGKRQELGLHGEVIIKRWWALEKGYYRP